MEQRKRARMEPLHGEPEAHGIEYHPFAVSCWGRLHPNAEQMLQRLARRIARRDGGPHQRGVLLRLRARIATEAMRRAAGMVIRCLPRCHRLEDAKSGVEADSALSLEAHLRAGHPGLCDLPPLYPAPLCGAGAGN